MQCYEYGFLWTLKWPKTANIAQNNSHKTLISKKKKKCEHSFKTISGIYE